MPVEIRELVIRTTVVSSASSSPPAPTLGGSGNEAIIAACVDQVLKVLERKRER